LQYFAEQIDAGHQQFARHMERLKHRLLAKSGG
jgi:hypothetical protein